MEMAEKKEGPLDHQPEGTSSSRRPEDQLLDAEKMLKELLLHWFLHRGTWFINNVLRIMSFKFYGINSLMKQKKLQKP